MSRSQQPLGSTPDWKYAKVYHDYWGATGLGSLRKWSCVHWMMLPHLFPGHWYQGPTCRARALWISGTLRSNVTVLPWSSFPLHRCGVTMSIIPAEYPLTPAAQCFRLYENLWWQTSSFGQDSLRKRQSSSLPGLAALCGFLRNRLGQQGTNCSPKWES